MSEPLVTYVQDHLAGASHALDLLHWMSDAHKDDSLGTFARALHAEITEDRNVLVRIAQRIGAGSSARLARSNLWNSWCSGSTGSGALWQALAVTARSDTRLEGVDYARLVSRAEMQEARVDDKRLEIAGPALRKAR